MAYNLPVFGDGANDAEPQPHVKQFIRYPKNAPGPFYVENGYCFMCGNAPYEAPELMVPPLESDGVDAHCYFRRQPETDEEVQQAIYAMFVSEAWSIRYGGDDPAILQHLSDHGLSSLCDQPVPPPRLNAAPLSGFVASLRAAPHTASDPPSDPPETQTPDLTNT